MCVVLQKAVQPEVRGQILHIHLKKFTRQHFIRGEAQKKMCLSYGGVNIQVDISIAATMPLPILAFC